MQIQILPRVQLPTAAIQVFLIVLSIHLLLRIFIFLIRDLDNLYERTIVS